MANPPFPSAKKRFGQHFLNDEIILDRIVDSICPHSTDHLIEIGPGPAVLTERLVDTVASLTLIEIDRDFAKQLTLQYSQKTHVTLINQDVLTIDWDTLDQTHPWRIVGNLPYNISTPLLFQLFAIKHPVSDLCFVLQKEVVDRLAAKPGTRTYGRLSVMAQYFCRCQPRFIIPPEAFSPPPKVTSAFIQLIPYTHLPARANDFEHFQKLVKSAFNQRRKTIANALKGHVSREQIIAAGIDPKQRPETLSVIDYVALANG